MKRRHSATQPRGGAALLENDEQFNRALKQRPRADFFLEAVPELTRSADIQLNERLSLPARVGALA